MLMLCLLLVPAADDPAASLAKSMLPVYSREAAEYTMAVESALKQPLELKKEPVFDWSNPTNKGLQQGVVFLWLRAGRPAAIGSIFSQPEAKFEGRKVIHELHALDADKLLVSRPDALNEWKPQAGLARTELPDAPAPATTAAARLIQMRRLVQEFVGHSTDFNGGDRAELRLLPTPLYRYPEAATGTTDGALFALVTTAGTDPEVLLLIEARREGDKVRWEYACGRFSDRSLYVQRKDKEVWSSVRGGANAFNNDPQHLYRVYSDKVVNLDGKLLARVRVSEKAMFGEFFPVTDK